MAPGETSCHSIGVSGSNLKSDREQQCQDGKRDREVGAGDY